MLRLRGLRGDKDRAVHVLAFNVGVKRRVEDEDLPYLKVDSGCLEILEGLDCNRGA